MCACMSACKNVCACKQACKGLSFYSAVQGFKLRWSDLAISTSPL